MAFTPDIVIYHSPCPDGFASAYVANKRFPTAELFPTNYGHALPVEKVKGKAVLMVDFSYPLDVLLTAAALCRGVVILDHHDTAEKALAVVPRINDVPAHEAVVEPGQLAAWFDMERAGVGLTWAFCFPHEPMPAILEAIEDRDLWRFALPHTEEIAAVVRSYPLDLAVWQRELMDKPVETLALDGKAILRFINHLVNDMASHSHYRNWPADWAGVPVVNCPPQLSSEVGHRLALFPSASFVATFHEADGIRKWSLRSEDKRTDVGALCKRYGGGGHRNAAGFTSLC